jgi:hypothetical protein
MKYILLGNLVITFLFWLILKLAKNRKKGGGGYKISDKKC